MIEQMPTGYDAWKTRHPDEDAEEHIDSCPQNPDAPEVYECGGVGEHLCSWVEREVNGCPAVAQKCECPTYEDMKEEAAERRFDAQRED